MSSLVYDVMNEGYYLMYYFIYLLDQKSASGMQRPLNTLSYQWKPHFQLSSPSRVL